MELYLEERKDGNYNLHDSEYHFCLRTGIKEDEIEKSIKYFIEKYDGIEGLKKKLAELDDKTSLLSPKEKERLESYYNEKANKDDLPYQDVIVDLLDSF